MGLTLAYALRNTTKKVLIIESGGEEISPKNQQLLDVEHSGLKVQFPGSTARIRALGGSSNCWAGFVMPFSKSVIDQWPMRAKGMEKYWPKVHDFLMLKGKWQDFYSPKEFLGNDFPEEMYSDFNMEYRQVHPLRIWAHYKDELIKSKNSMGWKMTSEGNIQLQNHNATVDFFMYLGKNSPTLVGVDKKDPKYTYYLEPS